MAINRTLSERIVDSAGTGKSDPDDLELLELLDALPTVDPADGVTIWNDAGVLKVASAA